MPQDEYNYNYKENDYGDHLGKHKIFYRKDWGGKPPKNNTVQLKHPISLIIISHSATLSCDSFEECANLVKTIQTSHFSKPILSLDIGYNFLIGGDGNIYVGRSWDIQNFHKKDSIGISFLGNFNFDKFTDDMIDAVRKLIRQGLELKILTDDYILVGENQTNSKNVP
ncbi:hypothetical protein NQ314_017303 [Rhamnusium bicolor]|uniref:Uncharacterized protein n=1 Tax=Rhamnusium bicolor TaxID=1586634 RepID=A0AAV8WTV1_9CUCU|nr:hypothetical protein NQ314_017303 [Rhamnusium bicolor]